jgi:hypothetical protein
LLDKGIQKNIGCPIRKVGHDKVSKRHREKKEARVRRNWIAGSPGMRRASEPGNDIIFFIPVSNQR